MDKKSLLAISLSIVVLLVWYQFFMPKPGEGQPSTQTVETAETVSNENQETAVPDEKDEKLVEVDVQSFDESSLTEESFKITTDNYKITLSNRGAQITSLLYGEREIELVAPTDFSKGTLDCSFYFSENSFMKGNSLDNALWQVSESGDNRFVFTREISVNGKKLLVSKIFSFEQDSYYFNLSYQFTAPDGNTVALPDGKIIFSANDFIGPKMENYTNRFNLLKQLYYTDKKRSFSKGKGFLKKASDMKKIDEKGLWAGLISRYFASILYADDTASDGIIADTRKESAYRTGLIYNVPVVDGSSKNFAFKVVIAEKKKSLLSAIDNDLEGASDTNKFIDPIRVAVLWSLTKLNLIIPNYGWCIIIFSIITKLIFLPLTQKSTESMKKMSSLQPEIQKIKDKYKDNQQKQQEETMKLYKEKGVNPMGGCLPLIIQMPFFISLYSALINSVELWNTPFALWIHDLSLPDTAFAVAGYDVHILPLIMTVTSFFQQKVSTVDTGAGGQQQMMMKIMPVVLLFIFWTMPSGLILYWTVQNILQVAHQLIVNRKKS